VCVCVCFILLCNVCGCVCVLYCFVMCVGVCVCVFYIAL